VTDAGSIESRTFESAKILVTNVAEWLCVLAHAHGTASELTPRFISPSDPAAQGTGDAMRNAALFADADNYLIDVKFGSYREGVSLGTVMTQVAVEQGSVNDWNRYFGRSGATIGMHSFGSSAPVMHLLEKFGFAPEKDETVKTQLARSQDL
jgi:Transketolase-like TK C-terminal domain